MGDMLSKIHDQSADILAEVNSRSTNADSASSSTVPLGSLVALGGAISALQSKTLTSTVSADLSGLNLYLRTGAQGALAAAKDGSSLLGTVMDQGKILGQARWKPVTQLTATQMTVLPPDPALAAVAIAVAVAQHETNKRLDAIIDLQKEMFDYIKERDLAKLRGTLTYLSDTMEELDHNWLNEGFLAAKRGALERVKLKTDQEIEFRRTQLEKLIDETSGRLLMTATRSKAAEIADELGQYRLAVYLYSYASMLEVLMDREATADSIKKKIDFVELRSHMYRGLYAKAHAAMEENAERTLGAKAIGLASAAGSKLGGLLQATPIGAYTSVDENLISSGVALEERKQDHIDDALTAILANHDPASGTFLDVMRTIKPLLTGPAEFFFDDEGMHYRELTEGELAELEGRELEPESPEPEAEPEPEETECEA